MIYLTLTISNSQKSPILVHWIKIVLSILSLEDMSPFHGNIGTPAYTSGDVCPDFRGGSFLCDFSLCDLQIHP